MSWKMLDLAVRGLNPSALKDWKNIFEGMSIWMQAIVVGALVLLAGVSILSCWWGLKMNRAARFAAGAASTFHIVLLLLTSEYAMEPLRAMICAAIAGVGAGFLYAFLERIFQFAAGFVLGTVLSAYVLPKFFHLKMTSGNGRIWALVIAIAAGVVFALLAKKLKWVLTALEGGIVLGLLCDVFLPVNKIPWIREKLTAEQIQNLLPLVIAASGVLIQLFQLLAIRAEQKALAIPTGDEGASYGDHETGAEPEGQNQEAEPLDEDTITMVQAEEVLVEKAKELALAATRSAEQARLKERYEDVSAGLYDTKVAAERLGMSEEAFIQGMKKAGYELPGAESTQADQTAEEAGTQTEQTAEEAVAQADQTAEEAVAQEEQASEKESAK